MAPRIFILTAIFLFPFSAFADYTDLAEWSSLPRLKSNVTAGLASSYDRSGGNNDFSQYESPPGWLPDNISEQVIVKTLTGPGEITRFWMPHRIANQPFQVRMYFDGESNPRIDTTSDVIMAGTLGYMNGPLITTAAGGQVCYEPIPFKESLRIETNNLSSLSHYYQYGYRLFSTDGPTESYTGTLTSDEQDNRTAVNSMLNNIGGNPAGINLSAITLNSSNFNIAPGSSVIIGTISGSGAIRRLTVKMDNATDSELEGLRLRVRCDQADAYAIDVPVAHFFGAGFGRVPYKSLPLGTDSPHGFYSYWPMPYREKITLDLYNGTESSIDVDNTTVEYENRPVFADDAYLHAAYSVETTVSGQLFHQLLNVQGQGHYVGNILWLGRSNVIPKSILEGDDIITTDNQTLPGTGLEDAYNGGFYYNWIFWPSVIEPEGQQPHWAIRPYYGLLQMNSLVDAITQKLSGVYRVDQYRWLIPDYIPFKQSINVQLENYELNANVTFGSTAFYYLQVAPIRGRVDLQEFTGSKTGTQVTIEIRNPGEITPVETHTATLDTNGKYAIYTGLRGPYDLTAKASHWLREKQTGLTFTGSNVVDFHLTNGDCDGDNEVTSTDLSIILADMDTANSTADLDGDNEITIIDLGIVLPRMDLTGDP
ncbi:MAG: DUF2961 domain-containing protein [Phycisphaerae bacterium]